MPKQDMNESCLQELIVKFQSGDRNAFVDLWERVIPYVFRLMKPGIDQDEANNLTGEVCIKLYDGGLTKYQPRQNASFLTWLHKFAMSVKIDELRRPKPLTFTDAGIDPVADELADTREPRHEPFAARDKSPLQILIDKEEDELRQNALKLLPELTAKLTPREQYVIYASFYDNKTDEEIAIILSGNAEYTDRYKKIRQRALKKLGRMFAEHGIRTVPVKR
ncbi:MAG: sigma-70 family RNA polymerase sigma factor [Planctomycetes bacterium]|nr:sigma-70 family RNA polymerase sigma factor [Planctomycetota bacterium]